MKGLSRTSALLVPIGTALAAASVLGIAAPSLGAVAAAAEPAAEAQAPALRTGILPVHLQLNNETGNPILIEYGRNQPVVQIVEPGAWGIIGPKPGAAPEEVSFVATINWVRYSIIATNPGLGWPKISINGTTEKFSENETAGYSINGQQFYAGRYDDANGAKQMVVTVAGS